MAVMNTFWYNDFMDNRIVSSKWLDSWSKGYLMKNKIFNALDAFCQIVS